jgi:hypothetical protein
VGQTALLPLRRKAWWGFFRPKNPTASPWFEPANLGTKGQHAISRPPKPLLVIWLWIEISGYADFFGSATDFPGVFFRNPGNLCIPVLDCVPYIPEVQSLWNINSIKNKVVFAICKIPVGSSARRQWVCV